MAFAEMMALAASPSDEFLQASAEQTVATTVENALDADGVGGKRKQDEEAEGEKRWEEESARDAGDRDAFGKTSIFSYSRRWSGREGCSHGDSCRYAHGEAELRPRLCLLPTRRPEMVSYISCNPESLVANAIELCTPTADEPAKAKGNRGWRKMNSVGLARHQTKSMPKS